jgi:hypothetical protein
MRKVVSILVLIIIALNSCSWPSRTIFKTYFSNGLDDYNILLAEKDSLKIYATLKLSDLEIKDDVKNIDSLREAARIKSMLTYELFTNNKGIVKIERIEIKIYTLENDLLHEQIEFTEFCKRKEWDVECFNSLTQLLDSITTVEYDKIISSQLLIRQSTKAENIFNEKAFYAIMNINLLYNNWQAHISFSDTLTRREIKKSYKLHP